MFSVVDAWPDIFSTYLSASAKKKPAAEVDPMAEARRAAAVSLLNALADEARAFRDPRRLKAQDAPGKTSLKKTSSARKEVDLLAEARRTTAISLVNRS